MLALLMQRYRRNERSKESEVRPTATTTSVLFTALAGTMGCDDTVRGFNQDAEEAEQRLEESVTGTEAEVEQDVAEFRRNSRKTLEAMDQRLERATKNAADEAKVEAREELQNLRRTRAELAERIDRTEARTVAEWNEAEQEFNRNLAELGRDINRALDAVGDEAEEVLR